MPSRRRKRSSKRSGKRISFYRRSNRKWIQSIKMKKGSLRKLAPKSAFTSKGTLKVKWLRQASKRSGPIGRKARLALTLRKLRKKS